MPPSARKVSLAWLAEPDADRVPPCARMRHRGRLAGSAVDFEYTPVTAGVVVEVRADSAREWGRFRHRLSVTRAKAPD
jgi:hypothetical protein